MLFVVLLWNAKEENLLTEHELLNMNLNKKSYDHATFSNYSKNGTMEYNINNILFSWFILTAFVFSTKG